MMKKYLYFLIYLVCETQVCVSQTFVNKGYEERLATQIVLNSPFKDFYNYTNNLNYFLTVGYGALKYGPQGLVTYVHESLHTYDNIKSAGLTKVLYYWLDSATLLKVPIDAGFVTSDSSLATLQASIIDRPFTKTYISCTNRCFSQSYGIYGLLEEFDAYSTAPTILLSSFDFVDTCAYKNDKTFWEGYLNSIYETRKNFFYFNTFFSAYLKYIAQNRKEFYQRLIADPSFKNAFIGVYQKYDNGLQALNALENRIDRRIYKKPSERYFYPFEEEYKITKSLSESADIQKFIRSLGTN
jgi:hypothetical protein